MRTTSKPIILMLICASVIILVSLACNLPRNDGRNLTLDPRAEDGSVSGSYNPPDGLGDSKLNFSVTTDGFATFRIEGAPESETLTVDLRDDQTAIMDWKGITLDGLGALTGEELAALEDLLRSDLVHGLEMIPLDISCQGDEKIDAKQVAALLIPLQMRFKYLVTERGAESKKLTAMSQCDYGATGKGEQASLIMTSQAAPVPVVFGYLPFDVEGAIEPQQSSDRGMEVACLATSSLVTTDGLVPINLLGSSPTTTIGIRTNETGPCNALCRGACGADCEPNNCKPSKELRCEKDDAGLNTGYVVQYLIYDCGLHQGCIDHDNCYDRCNAEYGCDSWQAVVCRHGSVSKENPPAKPDPDWWHCDQKAIENHGSTDPFLWMNGYGPQPMRETYEYLDKNYEKQQNLGKCPLGEPASPALDDEDASIPAGTYTGNSNFPSNRADAADFDSDVIITEDTITLIVEDDGTAHGDLISKSYTTYKDQSYHSDIIGVISGKLTDTQGDLSVSYTWRSYHIGPQCTPDGLCMEDTVNFDFLYHVNITGNTMTFTPAGEVEDYYSFELTKQ